MISRNLILNENNETQFIQCVCLANSALCHQAFEIQETRALQDVTALVEQKGRWEVASCW